MKKAVNEFPILKKYGNQGSVELKKGFNLNHQLNSVAKLPGVYLIYRKAKKGKNLVYIGRSGTMNLLGKFGKQNLKKRLVMKQKGIRRAIFFEEILSQPDVQSLKIYWFVTFEDAIRDLPSFVEAQLMQQYFDQNGSLPAWNRKF